MKVLYAVVCERAGEREDGRVDLLGVFRTLYAPGFPAQQDVLTLGCVIEWEESERGTIDFTIDLMDPSGAPALTISAQTEVSVQAEMLAGPPQTRLLIPLEGIVFPTEGTYTFRLTVGDEHRPLAPLHLVDSREPN